MRRLALPALLTCLAALGGCRPATSEPPTPVTSALGLTDWTVAPPIVAEERDKGPQRIVSTAPVVTETCCALGLSDRIVGRTRYCTHPPSVARAADIGALTETNIEMLVGLKPDLILISGKSQQVADRLKQAGFRYESVPGTSLSDVFTAIEKIGALCDRPQTAKVLAAGVQADLDKVTAHYANLPPARVLVVIGALSDPPSAPYVANVGSHYDELLQLAGCANAAPPTAVYAPLSLEAIVDIDPDVIIEIAKDGKTRPNGDADARRAWSGVADLQAVRKQRVHVIVGDAHFLPAPRVAFTYEALCRAIAEGGHD